MKDTIEYKGFVGSVHFSSEDSVIYGKIEGINDLVTFEGDSVESIKIAFEEAVDDYTSLCKNLDKNPVKNFEISDMKINDQILEQIIKTIGPCGKTREQHQFELNKKYDFFDSDSDSDSDS